MTSDTVSETLKILVVDDNESFCIGLKDVLEEYGHAIDYIIKGEDLSSALGRKKYDAVIMDLKLPNHSGIDLAAFVKNVDPGIACIISTGYESKSDVVEALNLGFDGFIEKPYKVEDLIAVLEQGVRLAKTHALESEIGEGDKRLRGFLDSMDIGLAIWDKDLNYVEMNQTVLDRFGLSREELIGKHITEINPHVGQTDRLEAYKRVIETGESFGTEEAIIPTIDGDRHFSVRSYRVGDGVGNITRDITDRIKSERELKERIRLTQILLDNMPCVALLLRPSTREIIASNQMARDAGAVSGEHCFSTWRQRETPCTFCLASKVWAGLGEQHLVVEERSKVWDISWIPISDDLYMHYVFDITDQTRREQELKDRTYELGERIKELTCIYGIGNLTEQRDISFEDLINGALVLIPPAWQFPSETCARIIYKQDSYITSNFIETEWSQSSRILVYGEIIGQVDVYYLNEMPESDEGPFQKEEQDLINEIARKIGGFIENRNAQDELRESEKKYRNMLDSARDGVTINVLNKLVYVNPSFLDMIGYTEKELFGFSSLDLHAPEYREMVYEITRKRREGLSVPSQYEVELIRKDGSRLPVSYSVSRIKFEGEMSSLTFIRDISERKQLEREMRESEERYRTLFDSTKEGILRYDSSGVIISGNQAAADILGYENPGEMMGLDAEVLYAESGDRESIRHKLAVEGSLIDIEISMRKKDGTLGIVSSTTTLYNDPITGEEVESSIFQDITDRKKAENELEQSEERYRNLFDDSLTGIVVRDNSGMITAINRTGAAIYGYKPYELIGKHISSLWVDPSQHSDAEKNLVEQGQSSELEINVRKKNGSLGIVAADAAVRYDKAGKPVRFETFFRDITDIRSYEVRLEALHGHTASLASADTLDGVASITRVYLEQIGYNMGGIGFVEGDMLAHRYIWGAEPSSDPIRPLNGPGITVEAVNTGKTLNIGDVRDNPLFIDGFADTNIISELAVPVMVAGKAVGIINIESEVRDAFSENDQRLVEILAQHVASAFSKIKYSERLNVLHGLAFELGHAESVEDVVETTLSIVNEGLGFQYSSFQLLEDEGLVMVGADGSAGMWETLPLTGKGVTTRAAREARTVLLGDVCVDPDFIQGSTDSRSELAVPILIDDLVLGVLNVESLLLNAFDEADARLMEILAQNVGSVLTRLRAAEDKIELERQILAEQVRVEQEQELGRLKTRFISTATHELRTPVTSILGYIELIMEDPQREITDSIRNDLNVVYRNANRLVKLTNDLLDVQRITSGRFEIHREQVDIVSTLYEMLEELSPLFSEKHQMVDLISPKELLVDVDEVRIGQLFINLLRNANKFTPEQGNIRIKVEPGEGSVLISVKDTGIGLSDEEIGKLFKPFPGIRHGLNVTSTGLGLSICKGIVELHGGRIWVESDGPGEGSTFYIKLPLGT